MVFTDTLQYVLQKFFYAKHPERKLRGERYPVAAKHVKRFIGCSVPQAARTKMKQGVPRAAISRELLSLIWHIGK
jgi:hypothetical protein